MQSKLRSLKETLTGTFLGMLGSWTITYLFVKHVNGIELATTLATFGCTIWSIVRGYCIRRYFNSKEDV